jgi:hypothetical protein
MRRHLLAFGLILATAPWLAGCCCWRHHCCYGPCPPPCPPPACPAPACAAPAPLPPPAPPAGALGCPTGAVTVPANVTGRTVAGLPSPAGG